MKYDIRISGYAANVEADTPEEAVKQIRDHAAVYCGVTVIDATTYQLVPGSPSSFYPPPPTPVEPHRCPECGGALGDNGCVTVGCPEWDRKG